MSDLNKHAERIRNTVFHSYPYNRVGLKPDSPHADDCEGCLINSEVDILVTQLNALSHVEDIVENLKRETELRKLLSDERRDAFKIADVAEEGSVAELVRDLVDERDRLLRLLHTIRNDISDIEKKIKESG